MKTAISINKELFDQAESYSQAAGLSRSGLYCLALDEYMKNNAQDMVTEKLNEYYGKNDSSLDKEQKAAAYKLLAKEDW